MGEQATLTYELQSFIEEYADDDCAARLLLFFADYPFARFNRLAIIHALDQQNDRQQILQALEKLVDKGLVNRCIDNDTALYCLGGDSATRQLVLQFGRLAKSQQRLLLNRVCETA